MKKIIFSNDQIRDFENLYKNNLSTHKIAEKYKVSSSTILRNLRKKGIR